MKITKKLNLGLLVLAFVLAFGSSANSIRAQSTGYINNGASYAGSASTGASTATVSGNTGTQANTDEQFILNTNLENPNRFAVPRGANSDSNHTWQNINGTWYSWSNTNWNDNWMDSSGMLINRKITTRMTGSEEVPPINTSMTGTLSLWLFSTSTNSVGASTTTAHKVDYRIDVQNGDNVEAAHLHCGLPGVSGPVIVNLYRTSGSVDVSGLLASETIEDSEIIPVATTTPGCFPQITNVSELAQAIKDNRVYVNVHTDKYPNGEIRGQVGNMNMSSSTSPSNSALLSQMQNLLDQLRQLISVLTGRVNNS